MNPNALAGKSLLVLNTSRDTVELLKSWFEIQGMLVYAELVSNFRSGGEDLAALVGRIAPDVIIYDVAVPYIANWQFFMKQREDGPLKAIPVIVTTPNERVLTSVVSVLEGHTVHEIVGKPADMQQLTEKVMRGLAVSL
jgi:CheY-like chemotaxis protein